MESYNSNEEPCSSQLNSLLSSSLQSDSLPSSIFPLNSFEPDDCHKTSLPSHRIADASLSGDTQLGQALSVVVGGLDPNEPKAQFLLSVLKLARDKTHWTVGLEPGDQNKVFETDGQIPLESMAQVSQATKQATRQRTETQTHTS